MPQLRRGRRAVIPAEPGGRRRVSGAGLPGIVARARSGPTCRSRSSSRCCAGRRSCGGRRRAGARDRVDGRARPGRGPGRPAARRRRDRRAVAPLDRLAALDAAAARDPVASCWPSRARRRPRSCAGGAAALAGWAARPAEVAAGAATGVVDRPPRSSGSSAGCVASHGEPSGGGPSASDDPGPASSRSPFHVKRGTAAGSRDTPIAHAAATGGPGDGAAGRRAARAARDPGADRRQPEGRRRQDDHRGQPGRGPRPARLRVLVVDLDPQGNASTALGVRTTPGTRASTTCSSTARRSPTSSSRSAGLAGLFAVPATIDLAGAEIELVSLGRARARLRRALHAYLRSEARRPARLRAHRLPAVARPAHGQRAGRRPTRCSSRSSASTTRSRGSASCSATSTWSRRTSTRAARLDDPAHHVRRPHPAGRPGGRRGPRPLRRRRCCRRRSRARSGSPRRRATARPS